jgi:ABC-type branched-subunit amino acid transport system substrate-binding protein
MKLGRRASVAIALPVLIVVAACGSSSSGKSAGGGAAAPVVKGPSGSPINLSVIATANGITGAPEVFDGAMSAINAINAAGGIKDAHGGAAHPLRAVECRVDSTASTNSPQVALKCATEAIKKGVVADVGKYLFAQLAIEAFQKQSVPLVGTFVVDQTDILNPDVFALSGGAVLELPAAAVALERSGATSIGFVSADNPAGRALPAFITPVLKKSKITAQQFLPLDPSADVSSAVSKLVQANPDGIVLGETASVSVRLTQALRSAGYQGKIAWSAANLNDTTIKQLGSNTKDIVVGSNYPAITDVSNQQIAKFVHDMQTYAPKALQDEFALNAWFSVQVAAAILSKVKTYTPASVLAATKGYSVDTGLVPAFTLGKADNYLKLSAIPRGTVYVQKLDNGKVVADGGVVDLNKLAGSS